MPGARFRYMLLRPHGRWKWAWLDVILVATHSTWIVVNFWLIPVFYSVNVLELILHAATLTASANPVFPFVWVLTLSLFFIAWLTYRPLGLVRSFFLAGSLYFMLEELAETPAFLLSWYFYPSVDGWWISPVMLVIYVTWTILGATSLPLWRLSRWSVLSGLALVLLWTTWVIVGVPKDIADAVGSQTVHPVSFVIEVGLKLLTFLFLASLVLANRSMAGPLDRLKLIWPGWPRWIRLSRQD